MSEVIKFLGSTFFGLRAQFNQGASQIVKAPIFCSVKGNIIVWGFSNNFNLLRLVSMHLGPDSIRIPAA